MYNSSHFYGVHAHIRQGQQNVTRLQHQPSKEYLSHSPTALRLSHRTVSSLSCISSMTRDFSPIFSSCCLFSGTSLTRHATSLQPIARTCLSLAQGLLRISVNFLTNSPLFSSRMRLALSRQKASFLCGGDHLRWPERTSAAYSSNVVCVF